MSKKNKIRSVEDIKKRNRSLTAVMTFAIIVQTALAIFNMYTEVKSTKESSIAFGQTVIENQMSIINKYIDEQEKRLIDYSASTDVYNLLANSGDSYNNNTNETYALHKQNAQSYIDSVSRIYEGGEDEGIYIADPNTKVLSHSYKEYIGLTMRTGDSLTFLQNALIGAGNNIQDKPYNAGVIVSPVSAQNIISMYKGVFDKNNPSKLLGYVGMGVYANDMINKLSMDIDSLPSVTYSLINIDAKGNDTYIFDSDKDVISVVTDPTGQQVYSYKSVDDENLKELCKNFRRSAYTKDITDYYQDKETRLVHMVAFSNDYNLMLDMQVPESEFYALANSAQRSFGTTVLFTVFLGVLIFMLNRIMMNTANKLNKAIKKQEQTVTALTESIDTDIISEAKSRAAFYDFIDKYSLGKLRNTNKQCDEDECYYFVMHCINGMADYNNMLGEEATDELISIVAKDLKDFYGDNVYRTGSKEFVCAYKNKLANNSNTLNRIDSIHQRISGNYQLMDGSIVTPIVDSAIIKQSKELNVHIISELKQLTKNNRPTLPGQIPVEDKLN